MYSLEVRNNINCSLYDSIDYDAQTTKYRAQQLRDGRDGGHVGKIGNCGRERIEVVRLGMVKAARRPITTSNILIFNINTDQMRIQ